MTGPRMDVQLVIGAIRFECWCMSSEILVSTNMLFHSPNVNIPLEKALPHSAAAYN